MLTQPLFNGQDTGFCKEDGIVVVKSGICQECGNPVEKNEIKEQLCATNTPEACQKN